MLKEALQYLIARGGAPTVRPESPDVPSEVVARPIDVALESLERFKAMPDRITHRAKLHSSHSFIEYVTRFKRPATTIYLDLWDGPRFVAVLDHHGAAEPSWMSHTASFVPRLSLEWQAWRTLHDGGPMSQQQLVTFMERHCNDLEKPEPSVMLTHVKRFEAVEKHTYQSAVNLDNGNIAVTYVKDGGQRKVEFPHTLRLNLPIVENERALVLEGRLRYVTREGSVAFTFQFVEDPARVVRDYMRALADRISAGCGDASVYEGAFNP